MDLFRSAFTRSKWSAARSNQTFAVLVRILGSLLTALGVAPGARKPIRVRLPQRRECRFCKARRRDVREKSNEGNQVPATHHARVPWELSMQALQAKDPSPDSGREGTIPSCSPHESATCQTIYSPGSVMLTPRTATLLHTNEKAAYIAKSNSKSVKNTAYGSSALQKHHVVWAAQTMKSDVRERRRDAEERSLRDYPIAYTVLPDEYDDKTRDGSRRSNFIGLSWDCSPLRHCFGVSFWLFVFLQAIVLLMFGSMLFEMQNLAVSECAAKIPEIDEAISRRNKIARRTHEALAVAVIVRNSSAGGVEIWTRSRQNDGTGRDPMYDGRWETLGRSLDHGESPVYAIGLAFKDVFDISSDELTEVRVVGLRPGDIEYSVTGQHPSSTPNQVVTDRYFSLRHPFMYVQALQGTTPWSAIGMVALVHEMLETHRQPFGAPKILQRWWRPRELLQELDLFPHNFVGIHYPILRQGMRLLHAATQLPYLASRRDLRAAKVSPTSRPQYRQTRLAARG
jgi:hypothetical protein